MNQNSHATWIENLGLVMCGPSGMLRIELACLELRMALESIEQRFYMGQVGMIIRACLSTFIHSYCWFSFLWRELDMDSGF